MDRKADARDASAQFDKMYNSLAHYAWTDTRIPAELKELIANNHPKNALELGCGLGAFSRYMASQGVSITGIDFSPIAIAKAEQKMAKTGHQAHFIIGDVTNLEMLQQPFDVAYDIGCFHCLKATAQQGYVAEAYRLLKQGSTLLVWTMDNYSPSGIKLNPDYMANLFADKFQLVTSKFSRRRLIASRWYWFVRR
jgi:cyclopropane fatty-acyl-phospholipid synthase-like methyltransferase